MLLALTAHLRPRAPGASASQNEPVPPMVPRLAPCLTPLEDSSPQGIVHALKTVGCALIKGVTAPAEAATLAELLAGYTPGGDVAGEDKMCNQPHLLEMAGPNQRGGDIVDWQGAGKGELLGTIFQVPPPPSHARARAWACRHTCGCAYMYICHL
eukprot:SAG11_NODE_3405_length_2466_cov_2.931559_4_plen_155_part_00